MRGNGVRMGDEGQGERQGEGEGVGPKRRGKADPFVLPTFRTCSSLRRKTPQLGGGASVLPGTHNPEPPSETTRHLIGGKATCNCKDEAGAGCCCCWLVPAALDCSLLGCCYLRLLVAFLVIFAQSSAQTGIRVCPDWAAKVNAHIANNSDIEKVVFAAVVSSGG